MTQYTDTQLRDTLLAAAREEFGAAWDGGEPMDPTPGFGAWEGDFLARCAAARPVGRRGRHWGRVVLAAAAVLAVLAGTVLAASPEVRETVRQFFRVEVVDNPRLDTEPVVHTDSEGNFYSVTQEWTITYSDGSAMDLFAFSFHPDGLNHALTADEIDEPIGQLPLDLELREIEEWRLDWLPEGYQPEDGKDDTRARRVTYTNGDGGTVEFTYTAVSRISTTIFEWQDGVYLEVIEVNGLPAYLITHEGMNIKQLYWADQEAGVYYEMLTVAVELEEIIQMAESVTLAE